MKSICSTTMTAVMLLLLASSPSSTEAFSAGSSRINTINTKNTNHHHAAIIIAPCLDNHNAAHRTRSSMQLSATSSNNNHNALGTANLRTKATQAVHKIRTLLLHLSTILTHKSKLILLSTILSIATMTIPQSAVAKSSGSFFSLRTSSASSVEDTSLVVSKSSSGGKVIVRKMGKFVVTIGAIGAGASFANVVRNKFGGDSCSDDNDDENCDGESLMKMSSKTEGEIKVTNGNAVKKIEEQTAKKKPTAEIEPMSEEWIQQQLNDVEKRSNVLNDAIKITQPPPATSAVGSNKKVSVGNTIGIPTTTPLVKNLDSKIEMLQRRDAERSIEQQRINDEQAQVKMEKKKVAIVEAERKIELAEKEYRKSQQQQVQVVEKQRVVEEESTAASTSTAAATSTAATSTAATPASISIKFGPGGSPAKSRQEDLELTREVILEHVNSMDSVSSGVVDDDE